MSSQMNTPSSEVNQNKPNGYINVSATVKSKFFCCISKSVTTQNDVSNRKIHNNESNAPKIEMEDKDVIPSLIALDVIDDEKAKETLNNES